MNAIKTILVFTVAGIWGYFQPVLFPPETFGFLWVVTAILGGMLAGKLASVIID